MLSIKKLRTDSPIDYAAEELKKYLRMMMPECGDITVRYAPDATDGFRLGLMADFGLDTSDVRDTELDDIIYIKTDARGGIIAGSNSRSVLIAVYEFLRQNGCRWLMPGVDGEYIPMQDVVPVEYRHVPSCRYRGWCNEGSESQECMFDTIDFAPKVGLNTYMLEFKIPTSYYKRYYNHMKNEEARPPEPVSDMQILQWKIQCESEISKRGLSFHDMGHGWSADPFGIDSSLRAWDGDNEARVPAEARKFIAEVGGERKLWHNVPNYTQYCMSSPEARGLVTNAVADYAEKHSNADFLHIWLGDGRNNHCECAECRKKAAPDWYIIQLNEIDLAATMVQEEAHPDANIIWGTSFDESMNNEIRITIIATGFNNANEVITAKEEKPQNEERKIYVSEPLDIPAASVKTTVPPVYSVPEENADTFSNFVPPVAEQVATPAVETAPIFTPAVESIASVAPETAPVKEDTAPAQESDPYQEYDNLFTCIKRIKRK